MRTATLTLLIPFSGLIWGCKDGSDSQTVPNAPVLSPTEQSPNCPTGATTASLFYLKSSDSYLLCDENGTHAVTENPSTTRGAGGYLLRKAAFAPNDECRYGGIKAEGGMDSNSNGTLEDNEVTSTLPVCDSSIENIGKATYKKYVHSVGIVVAKTSGLLSGGETSAGTGWIVGDGMVVTNGHVAKVDATLGTTVTYTFYLPKTEITAETILSKGLPTYAGFSPSTNDFVALKASAVDLTPYTTTTSDAADLAFLTVQGLTGRPALPLADKGVSNTAGSAPDVADLGSPSYINLGDGIFTINYSQVQGPRLAIGTVTTIQTCAAWFKTTTSKCMAELGIPDNRRLLFWWGYGDHGGSGSPIFDRFGKVAGIFTYGSVPPDTFQAGGQFVSDIKYWLAKPRTWKSVN
jgi:hypothetical protein